MAMVTVNFLIRICSSRFTERMANYKVIEILQHRIVP